VNGDLSFEIIWLDLGPGDEFKIIGRETITRWSLDAALSSASNKLAHQIGKAAAARGFVVQTLKEQP